MSVLNTLQFGSGLLGAIPNGGNQPTNPSPVQIGVLQNVKLTFSGDIKELKGQLQYPVDSAVGNRSIKGSFSFARMTLQAWNNLFFGESAVGTGGKSFAQNVPAAVPASTPYTVTPTVPGSGTWASDGGVFDATTGVQLQPVSTSPTTGQYTVSAGVYTFAAADEGRALLFDFYCTTTTGSVLTINNHVMGFAPIVSLYLTMPYQGFDRNIYLPNVRIGKLDLATKQDDYTMTDTDFQAFADPSGVVGKIYLPQ